MEKDINKEKTQSEPQYSYRFALNLGIDAFPFMISFLPPTFYFFLFSLYIFEGRYAGYIPTISETGTELPNNSFMVGFFCAISASVLYQLFSLMIYVKRFYSLGSVPYFLMKTLTIVCSVAYNFISCYPMNTHPFGHFSATFTAFFGVVLFQIIVLLHTMKDYSIGRNILRFIYIILQIIPLVVCAISSHIWNHRINVTIQAISEYSLVIFLPFFFLSFTRELSEVELVGVISKI